MLYISTSCVNQKSISNCLDLLIQAGISNIELSGGMSFQDDIKGMLAKYKIKNKINFIVHNYFPPPRDHFVLNIASSNKETRELSLSFIKRSIDLSNFLGSDRYMVHAGYNAELKPPSKGDMFEVEAEFETQTSDAWNIMFDSLYELDSYGNKRGIKIGLENLFPFGDKNRSLLTDDKDINTFLNVINDNSNLGLLLDLGHLTISANYQSFDRNDVIDFIVDKFSNKLFGIHLSENDGINDVHLPLEKESWQLQTAKRLYRKNLPVTLESRNLKKEDVLSQFELISNYFSKE